MEAGADFVEVDVRTTTDGKLVLMHDADVSRTTNGKGLVSNLTLEEIRRLETAPGVAVPTLDEALAFAPGRIGVYVDSKAVSAAAVMEAIERHGMGGQVLIYGGPAYLKEIAGKRPEWKVMPEAGDPQRLRSLLEALKLKVVAFDGRDFNEETMGVARQARVEICVDRIGPADSAEW